jgi:hypothetical protein
VVSTGTGTAGVTRVTCTVKPEWTGQKPRRGGAKRVGDGLMGFSIREINMLDLKLGNLKVKPLVSN